MMDKDVICEFENLRFDCAERDCSMCVAFYAPDHVKYCVAHGCPFDAACGECDNFDCPNILPF